MAIRFMFTNSKFSFSPIIRVFTWSEFSHMAIIIDDETVLHSDLNGVRLEKIKSLQERSTSWMIAEYECERPHDLINVCMTQIGKPYDYLAWIGILFRHINLKDNSKWVCSELPEYGAWLSGQSFFYREFNHRITPQHWLMLPHIIIEKSKKLIFLNF